jgi:DNA-binding LytR/AlgR family response regulator
MNIAIVEDEPIASLRLEQAILACAPEARIVARLGGVRETAAWLDRHGQPDLLFLDIRLRDGVALDLTADRNLACPVIFTTAHDEYVMDAFTANAIDYLLKPVDADRVARAVDKYRQIRSHFLQQPREARLQPVPDADTPGTARRRYVVRRGAEYVTVPVEQIAYFCTEHKITFLVAHDGQRFMVDDPLSMVESQVDACRFFRANRQHLVSVEAIARFRPGGKGQIEVELQQPAGFVITISQERAAEFRRWIDR